MASLWEVVATNSGATKERVEKLVEALTPSYQALPKNGEGHLEHQTVRYILHRLFVQRHGWYLKGLEPNGDVFHANATAQSLKEWVPSYLIDQLESEAVGGVDLYNLAVLAVALEDLIQKEAGDLVNNIYKELVITKEKVDVADALLVYAASFLSNGAWDAETAIRSTNRFVAEYHDWQRTQTWLDDLEKDHLKGATSEGAGQKMATEIAVDFGARYGEFNERQCKELKGALMGMWSKAATTGRIRLSDFYRVGLDTQWDLVEKKEYLAALGALDASNASTPMVIVANYLTARPNCLEATNLYSVCCRNECEDILGYLEQHIASPLAEPVRILELIRSRGSDTKPAPVEVDEALVERLTQIADQHGGRVQLHGRLFAQWMHHVYPNECPFPHEAGIADPSSPDQWLGADVEVAASEEERRQLVDAESCGPEEAAAHWKVEVPWSETEELLTKHAVDEDGRPRSPARTLGQGFVAVVLLGGVALALLLAGPAGRRALAVVKQRASRRHVGLAALCLLLVVADMVHAELLAVLLCVGLLAQRAFAMELPCGKCVGEPTKQQKCMV